MSTVTLVANTDYSDLTVADDDTIELAGFTLTLDVVPAQTGVQVITPGTAGKVVLGAPTVYTLPGWQFTAGTGPLITSVTAGTTFGGNVTGGTASSAYGITTNNGTLTGNIAGGSGANSYGCANNYGNILGDVTGGSGVNSHGVFVNYAMILGDISGGSTGYGVRIHYGQLCGKLDDALSVAIYAYQVAAIAVDGPNCKTTIPANVSTVYSLFGPLSDLATVDPSTDVIVLANTAAALRLGNRIAQRGVNL